MKIYILCPAKEATGGPEALHQLYHKLRQAGRDAVMYYTPDVQNPIHPNYKQYNVAFERVISDTASNVLIAPEVFASCLNQYKHIQKAVWWLSLDNYFLNNSFKRINRVLGSKIGFKHYQAHHFTQSEYAKQFLKSKGIESTMLSDYISPTYLGTMQGEREDWVAYNPAKGFNITKKLMQVDKTITWKPIQNMSTLEVKVLLSRCKVYVDFGKHPGKDRLPREAALSGCCIITGKRGSAAYREDVSIPSDYKFGSDTAAVIEKIKGCFGGYEEHKRLFSFYRMKIQSEEKTFEQEVQSFISQFKTS